MNRGRVTRRQLIRSARSDRMTRNSPSTVHSRYGTDVPFNRTQRQWIRTATKADAAAPSRSRRIMAWNKRALGSRAVHGPVVVEKAGSMPLGRLSQTTSTRYRRALVTWSTRACFLQLVEQRGRARAFFEFVKDDDTPIVKSS